MRYPSLARFAASRIRVVMADGVRLNDAQSGHHNAGIPVPLQDIESA